jgi:DNA invertase Pin-like site-specific DNA recombinase
MGTVYGYARVSTPQQSLDAQIAELKNAGATKVFSEKFTGRTNVRPEFQKLMKKLQPGDTVLATKLDRLGRSSLPILNQVSDWVAQGIAVKTLDGWVDTATDNPASKFMRTMLAGVAEMERELIAERREAGLARARAMGVRSGPKIIATTEANKDAIRGNLVNPNRLTVSQMCERLGISRGSYYRLLAELRDESPELFT